MSEATPSTPSPPTGRSWRAWLGVLAVYLAGAGLFLWPLPLHLDTHIWGDRFDAWTTLWLMDHLGEGLREGTLQAETTEILYPFGYNLWSFGHAALQAMGAVMVALGLPLVASYNLLLLGGIASTGLFAHLLGRELGGSHAAGFVAGGAMASSPYLYGEGAAGCIELTLAGLIPLFAWTLVRLARRGTWQRALQSALALAIVGPFNWYYTLFTGMFGLGFAAWMALTGRLRTAGLALGAMALAGLLNAPLIPLVRRETPTRPTIEAEAWADRATWTRAKEVADVQVPLAELTDERLLELDALQVIQNSTRLPALLRADFPVNPLDSTPGRLAFLVGLVGFAAAPRRTAGWVILAGGATVLTLGPFLTIDGTPPLPRWSVDSPLPYFYAYEHIPFFSKAYRPYRIGVIALMCLSAAGAAGLGALRGGRRPLPPRAAQGLAAAVLLVGFSQPLWVHDQPALRPMAEAAIPPLYERLRDATPGAVVEVPLAYQPFSVANARFQYNQVVHDQPLLNCNQLIRRTDLARFRQYVLGNSFLETLLDLGRTPPPYRFSGEDLADLAEDGFRYVVLHHKVEADTVRLAGDVGPADFVGLAAREMLQRTLGAPVIEDADGAVFVLPEAEAVAGRIYRTEAEGYLALDHPLDAARTGLPVVLQPGQRLVLWEGRGRAFGLWVRAEAEGLQVMDLDADGVSEAVAGPRLGADAAHWTWVGGRLDGSGPRSLQLVNAGTDPGRLWLTGLELAVEEPGPLVQALPPAEAP